MNDYITNLTSLVFVDSSSAEFEMLVSNEDIHVNAVCASKKCLKFCSSEVSLDILQLESTN